MRKHLLLGAFLLGSFFTANAQQTLFEDSFETYTTFAITGIGSWTLVDADGQVTYGFNGAAFENSGEPMAYIVFDSAATDPALEPTETSNWSARTGNKSMISFAGAEGAANNDWLISPQVQLAATGNTVKFWAKTCDGTYSEKFKVGVSTTGVDTADFTVISAGASVTAPNAWTEFTYDLDAYANQQVYISINCISNDQFGFAVDDFSVTADDVAGLNDNLASNLSIYPNPVNNIINIDSNDNISISKVSIADLNGRTVKSVSFDGVSNASVNIADLASGMYMMNITSDKGMTTKKIMKN
ncbi:T9SS-dependent choice-of-anchor J family protein [Flavobacterium sp. AG291]|uniref:T9SS-dependent choice-of-anchor J family protein n=1 Tax=Flavobacterium sp. AG291 TaxID=2184000 RepID=UPI000E0AFFD4|nr:choice-of-anchor J domain-containing protein [Flavobacterium sp. AG291]RDI04550.1 putative secreted protein (Por secretion system target) [Flavobacterium sp. AG291]